MKIVSHKRMNRVRVVSGRWNNLRNYGLCFAIKVTAVFLISCTLIAFQVATTLSSSKSDNGEDVTNLIRQYDNQQQSQESSQSSHYQQEPVSVCDSCGESESETDAEAEVIRQIANEEFELEEDNVNSNANTNSNANIMTDSYVQFQLDKPVITSEINKNKIPRKVNVNNVNVNSHKVIANNYNDNGDNKLSMTTTITNGINSAKESQSTEVLDNVFFSVKSTKRFHKGRLEPVLKTWFNLAKDQTWIFTDDDDPELVERTNGHVINTHCPSTHYRQALCCKMASEFDTFLQTTKSWFCHFDDDNYVNVPALLEMLGRYNSKDYWYLGKPSLKSPIRIRDPDNHTEEVSFWFATGGAGFCLSRALALRMSPLASGGIFTKICDRIQLPDDVTVGYIAGHLLGQNLTVIPQFHSHFETMKFIDIKSPSSEITFSYLRYPEYENVLEVDGFSAKDDPTRFLSLHCKLFPHFSFCPNNNNKIDNSLRHRRRR